MDPKSHWERIYTSQAPNQVSWYRRHLETSVALIERAAGDRSSSIIDVRGGESTLVDDLVVRGFQNITVLDISESAIEATKRGWDRLPTRFTGSPEILLRSSWSPGLTMYGTTGPFFTSSQTRNSAWHTLDKSCDRLSQAVM